MPKLPAFLLGLGCPVFTLFFFGRKFKGPLEPHPIGCIKSCCFTSCYAHQQSKEPFNAAVAGAATTIGNAVGQQEMS